MEPNVEKIHNIFTNYFGEDKVDYNGYEGAFLIYFPEVTVTNERGESIDITKLFVKVPVTSRGALDGYLGLCRTEYTLAQFSSGYMHSHAPRIDPNRMGNFLSPCLGTGPLNPLTRKLRQEGYNEANWKIFCVLLSQYVTIESLQGGPYIKLSSVRLGGNRIHRMEYLSEYPYINHPHFVGDFVKYLLKNSDLKFSVINNKLAPALSTGQIVQYISNEVFKALLTPEFESYHCNVRNLVDESIYSGKWNSTLTEFYYGGVANPTLVEGTPLFRFKGNMQYLHIVTPQGNTENEDTTCIISPGLALYLMNRYLTYVTILFNNYKENQNILKENGKIALI